MANQLFSNNASALLASTFNDSATGAIVQVQSGYGSLYPSPSAGDFFIISLEDANGNIEIMKVTSRSSDIFTVAVLGDRGLEGTTRQSWTSGNARVELRLTKETMERLLQKAGGTMTGDVDFDGNEIQNARVTGTTVVVGGQTVGTAIRGTEDDSSNELAVPSDGSRATAGASPILTQDDDLMQYLPANTIVMWYGSSGSVPTGWQICNGNNGTPDLRNRFVRGVGGSTTVGQVVAEVPGTATSSSDGSHTHTSGAHTLTIAEIPSHQHLSGVTVRARNGSWSGTDSFGQDPPWDGVLGGDSPLTYSENIWEHHQLRAAGTTIGMPYTQPKGGSDPHSHTLSSDGAHTHTVSTTGALPNHVCLYFIMKLP